jgi:hypothetical protein
MMVRRRWIVGAPLKRERRAALAGLEVATEGLIE